MSILNKFNNQGSLYTELNGTRPQVPNLQDSKLHKTYSINGNPIINGKPSPSNLDLNGETPARYLDNPPR